VRLPLPLLNLFLRWIEKPYLRHMAEPLKMRRRFEFQARWLFLSPPYTTYLDDILAVEGHSVSAHWAMARGADRNRVILYFHGGGYLFGSPRTHRAMLARLSGLAEAVAVLPDYRKAPEHPFPAATEDALLSYRVLLARGYAPENIVLGGDSAGGGLALALLHLICQNDLPHPAGLFAFSPWTDLTLSGASLKVNRDTDPYLPVERTKETAAMYLAGADASNPTASPLFGQFRGAGPVYLQVGSTEILLDDSRRLLDALVSQGVRAELHVWPDVPHVWQIFQGRLNQADKALADVAGFVAASLGPKPI